MKRAKEVPFVNLQEIVWYPIPATQPPLVCEEKGKTKGRTGGSHLHGIVGAVFCHAVQSPNDRASWVAGQPYLRFYNGRDQVRKYKHKYTNTNMESTKHRPPWVANNSWDLKFAWPESARIPFLTFLTESKCNWSKVGATHLKQVEAICQK